MHKLEAKLETQTREEMCRVGASLFNRGYVHATAGNISVRLEDGYLITPTDACLGNLDPASISKLDLNLKHISGDIASKTIALHASIYSATAKFNSQTACVIHTHSTFCVAQSLAVSPQQSELLQAITPYFVMKVGHVPLIPYHRPGDPKVAQIVADTIARYGQSGTPIRAVMLSRLGPNVWHDSPAQAMAVLEELEETAKLVHLSKSPITPLSEPQIQELRDTFGATW
jgi:ribulose-5-phosphate 4-epimerase/fuculose-1-phosphate aldolase